MTPGDHASAVVVMLARMAAPRRTLPMADSPPLPRLALIVLLFSAVAVLPGLMIPLASVVFGWAEQTYDSFDWWRLGAADGQPHTSRA